MENTSDSFMPRPLLFCLKSGRSVCYSVPDNRMSVKIKVSYTTDQELQEIVSLLSPVMKNVKIKPQKGKFKRAYISQELEQNTKKC